MKFCRQIWIHPYADTYTHCTTYEGAPSPVIGGICSVCYTPYKNSIQLQNIDILG